MVRSLGREDPLEEGMAAHSHILAWTMDRGAWWATVHGATKSQTRLKRLSTKTAKAFPRRTARGHQLPHRSQQGLLLACVLRPPGQVRSWVSSAFTCIPFL